MQLQRVAQVKLRPTIDRSKPSLGKKNPRIFCSHVPRSTKIEQHGESFATLEYWLSHNSTKEPLNLFESILYIMQYYFAIICTFLKLHLGMNKISKYTAGRQGSILTEMNIPLLQQCNFLRSLCSLFSRPYHLVKIDDLNSCHDEYEEPFQPPSGNLLTAINAQLPTSLCAPKRHVARCVR